MDATDLAYAGAARQAQLIAAGEVSAREVVAATLDRIEKVDPQLNAYRVVLAERALTEADQADARRRAGDARPLLGVPIAIKDDTDVSGVPTARGSAASDPAPRGVDAEVVRRLRAAGAVIVGKTSVPELMIWPFCETAAFGATRNPWALDRTPGGSSGGSGAAVAAGLAAIGVGTDTGGSIRIPAACCGIVGFKPTHEAVSREGCWPLADTLDHIGPLTRDVEDTVLAFEVMAGLPSGCVGGKNIERPRLIKPETFFYEHLDTDIRARIEAALKRLQGGGASLTARNVEDIQYAPAAQFITICAEGCQSNWELLTKRGEGISADVRLRLEVGQFIGAIDYVKAQRLRRRIRDNMLAALKDGDVFVLPTVPIPIPKSGVATIDFGGRTIPLPGAMTRLTGPFNSAGLPVCSIAIGKDGQGLPVSLQFVGRPGADATVLAVARWAQEVLR